jgi:hypothetical protein
MEVRDEHVEFAIVQRFRDMLQEPHPRYEVSFAYALFTVILCWSTQRLRTDLKKDNSPEARAAARVWTEFEKEPISLAPWSIAVAEKPVLGNVSRSGRSLASSDFHGHTADRLLKNLRDAVAHGDARKVEPFHTGTRSKPDCTLVGFKFSCEEGYRQNRQWTVTWTGEITLLAVDLVRIADEVSRRFCEAMEEASKYNYLRADAQAGVKEAA